MMLDSPMHRTTIMEMSDEDLDGQLLLLRERRLKAVRIMQEAEMAKRSVYIERLRERLAKELRMLSKAIDAVDKALEKAEMRALKVRAIRLEVGE